MNDLLDRINKRRQELAASGVPSGDIKARIAARRSELSRGARQQYTDMGFREIATANDGVIMENDKGERVYTSPGYNTNDPAKIAEIMNGATVADTFQSDLDRERIAKNPVAARVQEFNQGAPIVGEWLDEAVGLVSPEAAKNMRATSDAMERQHPIQSGALNVLGGVAYTAPLAVMGAGQKTADFVGRAGSKIGRLARVMGAGAAAGLPEGVASGAGREAGDRLRGAAVYGAMGAGLGAALAPVADLAGIGAAALARRMKKLDVAAIAREFGIDTAAARTVKEALINDDLGAAAARLGKLGDDAMLADAGPATQALLDAASKTGGKALAVTRDAVEGRSAAFGARLPSKLDSILGTTAKGVKTAAREISESTSGVRRAAYERAYSTAVNYADDAGRKVEDVLARVPPSTMLTAIKEANEEMRSLGLKNMQIMAEIGPDGSVVFREMPNVRQLDEIKKALGNIGREAVDKFGRPTGQGIRYSRLAGELGGAIGDAVPAYRTAVRLGGDKIQMDDALDLGRKLLFANVNVEDVYGFVRKGLSSEARAAMVQGVRETIENTMSAVRRTITDPNVDAREAMKLVTELSSRKNTSKLRLALGKAKAEALMDELDKQATALLLRGAVARNSDTAIRGAIQGQAKTELTPNVARRVAGNIGNPLDAAKEFTRALAGIDARSMGDAEKAMFAQIADALTRIRGADAQRALVAVQGALAGQPMKDAEAKLIGRMITDGVLQIHQSARQLPEMPR